MNGKIDMKSTLIGLLAGIVVTMAVGAGYQTNQTGRYQISVGNGHGLIIDTATGQVWQGYLGSELFGKTDANFFDVKSTDKK